MDRGTNCSALLRSVARMNDTSIRPFHVDVPDVDLDDLRGRLARVRWPDELPGAGWDFGVPIDYVSELVEHWRNKFDWRAVERSLNEHPQFTTRIDGQRVYFIHARSPEPEALPLIATHGWPLSVLDYVDLIGPLTDPRAHGGDPAEAFHLVIPAMPGVGFSGPTTESGWDMARVARAWAQLMARLGYERYGAHGNDSGSMVSPEIGRFDAEHVVGVHVTQLFSFPSGDPAELADLSDEDAAALQFLEGFAARGGLAYNAYQSAQPQTLAYALQDSPAGWLAWVTQLFQRAVDRDYILTNAAIYWLTGTIGSSMRYYHAEARAQRPTEPTTTPTGVAIFAEDFQSIRRLADRDHANIVHWRHYDRGSHFSPHDAPDLLVDDIRDFFRSLR
jgi:pimeloyl-ACP methyl ester carboxylesterase